MTPHSSTKPETPTEPTASSVDKLSSPAPQGAATVSPLASFMALSEGKPDLREKGAPKDGVRQALDRRLFVKFSAFGGCEDASALGRALEGTGFDGVLYEDLHDPRGIGLLSFSEAPARFLDTIRPMLQREPFAALTHKPEFSMLGRTYALGHEPNLEDWLLERPRRVTCDPDRPWAVWYPLRRTGEFSRLPADEQKAMLREHGMIGHAFGEADLGSDVRLACHGLDPRDNDFIIGLVGRELHPLSALVETMRKTRQTSRYIQSMGPFFVGRSVWRRSSGAPGAAAGKGERTFRIRMSERCYRFKPDALPNHAPRKPGVYEFVAFNAKMEPQILFVGLASTGTVYDALGAHMMGNLRPTLEDLQGANKDVYFDFVEWSDGDSPDDLKDIAGALMIRNNPRLNLNDNPPASGRYARVELKEEG